MNLKSGNRGIVRYLAILLFPLLFLTSSSVASEKKIVKDIRYWTSSNYTRVVIDLSEPVEFSKNRISSPDRIYFDLKNTTLGKTIQTTLPIGDGILKAVRTGQFDPDTVRIVIDLERIEDFKTYLFEDPTRLVIDIYGISKNLEKPELPLFIRRIVIDPGHGGHDPGAIGHKGLCEKDVVLDIALKLKKILMAYPSYEVFLTRETDVFISLEERTAIANKKEADLFVSIHANASPKKKTKGIETYLLNWTTDEEAMSVAARENAISLGKMKEINQQWNVVEIIKSDLMRQNKRDESIKLANFIQSSLISKFNDNLNKNIIDLGVKQALFYVLFGAKMPSVLVEALFISNTGEEKLLSGDSYRMHIAESIAKGLDRYINSVPSIQKIAGL